MAEHRQCPECGAELPSDAPEALCAKCLLTLGLEGPTRSEASTPSVWALDSSSQQTSGTLRHLRGALGLPLESHRRLGILALIYATGYLITAFLIPRPTAETGRLFGASPDVIAAFFTASSLLVYVVVRSGRLGGKTLGWTGVVFQIYGAVGIEIGILTVDPSAIKLGLSWTAVWIVSFPLFVPTAPGVTLWSSALAASARPLMLGILWLEGNPIPDSPTLVQLIVPNYLCVGIAVLASSIFYWLRRDVQEARQMGSYNLQRKLGEGGMGEVWVAEHGMLARPAAIKLVRSDLTSDPNVLERFEREVQATAQLRSPHTIAVYDYGVTPDGTFYYVMELLDGIDLENLVHQNGALPVGRVVHILRQACQSLAEAHDQGIVHRDIKPANIFLCRYGRDVDFVKVLDFGLVKQQGMPSDDVVLTQANVFTGTPTYASPEMARGEFFNIDRRSDIYALGCVAYWLLSGRHVFEASTPFEMLMKHVGESPEPVSRHAGQAVPPELDRLLLECVEKQPEARIGTAEALDARLATIQQSCTWPAEEARKWWAEEGPSVPAAEATSASRTEPGSLVVSKWTGISAASSQATRT
jgi:serine/threonine protein kinase